MKSRMSRRVTCTVAAVTYLFFGALAGAAEITGGANGINISADTKNSGSQSPGLQHLRVTGPNGYAAVTAGSFLSSDHNGGLADGVYRYEVTEKQCGKVSDTRITNAAHDNAANGRAADALPSRCRDVVVDSGAFRIVNGAVPSKSATEE